MFIEVKYGRNETLICNPYCIVVNLMENIKERTGLTAKQLVLDLSDITGLVKDLDLHRMDKADKFLTNQGPYILVEKQVIGVDDDHLDHGDNSRAPSPMEPTTPQYNYIPLLDDCEDLFPEYKLRVTHSTEKKLLKKPRSVNPVSKSPSPAGRKQKKRAAKKK